jgi:hypothetical protein
MWGFEMFQKRAEKQRAADGKELGGAPSPESSKARKLAGDAIAKAAGKGDVPVIGTDTGFQDTEAFAAPSEVIPKIGDSSRLLVAPEPKAVTPTDKDQGLEQFSISTRVLKANLDAPILPKAPLPKLGRVSDPIAPNRWGADQVLPPKTDYQPTPVSDRGLDELRIDPRTTEAALADPRPAMAHHKPRYDHTDGMYDKRQARMRTMPSATAAPLLDLRALEGVALEKSDPKTERDARWQQAESNFQETDGSPVPASLRGGKLPLASAAEQLKERQRIADARSAEGLGVYNGRPTALPTADEEWERARRAAQTADLGAASERVAAESRKGGKRIDIRPVETGKEADREALRLRYWDKIQELRQLIVLAADPSEKELMEDVLARSLKNYERDFGAIPEEA